MKNKSKLVLLVMEFNNNGNVFLFMPNWILRKRLFLQQILAERGVRVEFGTLIPNTPVMPTNFL